MALIFGEVPASIPSTLEQPLSAGEYKTAQMERMIIVHTFSGASVLARSLAMPYKGAGVRVFRPPGRVPDKVRGKVSGPCLREFLTSDHLCDYLHVRGSVET